MDELAKGLEQIASSLGADYFGTADLTPAAEFIRSQGGELAASFPRAISVGITLPPDLVRSLVASEGDPFILSTYNHYVYKVCNPMLDNITMILASKIAKKGYRAMPVQASLHVPGGYYSGGVSQKLAAHLAGLGWIGKSGLVVTPKDGPRVRWGTVLTDAPVETGRPLEPKCGNCSKCVEACPPKALTGSSVTPGMAREKYIDVKRCDDYRNDIASK